MKPKYTITQMIDILAGPDDVDVVDVIQTLGEANETIGRLELDCDSLRQVIARQERTNEKVRDLLTKAIDEGTDLKRRIRRMREAVEWMQAKLTEKFGVDGFSQSEALQWRIVQEKIRKEVRQ